MYTKLHLVKIYIKVYFLLNKGGDSMTTAKLFENGRSQACTITKREFRFNGDEVIINKIGNVVLLMPKKMMNGRDL